jgi:hypothetical protein
VRIGIDARLLTGAYTGDRTYWRGLLKAFNELLSPNEHRLVLFSTRPIPSGMLPESPLYEPVVAPARSERLWSLLRLPKLARHAPLRLGSHAVHSLALVHGSDRDDRA